MENSYKKLLLGCSSALFSVILNTETALALGGCLANDCTGYTKSSAQCSGKTAIRCPFDTSKYYCQDDVAVSCGDAYKYECTGVGYTGGSGEACDGKYVSCTCKTDYHYSWDGSACTQNCNGYYHSCTGSNESPGYDSCNGYYNECTCNNGTYWNGSSCSKAEVVLEVCVSLPYCRNNQDCFNRTPSVGGSISQSGGTYKSFDGPQWGSTSCTDFTVNALEQVTISFYGLRATDEYWVGMACLLPTASASAGYLSCTPSNVSDYTYIQAQFQPDQYTAKNTVTISYEGYQQYQNVCNYGNAKVDYNCHVSSSYY